jgi:thiamine-phosphate pyrophosphorylase
LKTAESVLKGGAKLIQLRDKEETNGKALLVEARGLQSLCGHYGAVWICNDRLDIALAGEASGVHLGQDDIAPSDVRRIAGEKLIIGRSTHSVEQARNAVEVEQADYIGVGSVYDTSTKQGRILAGMELAEQVCDLGLGVPVFAIGGITLERVKELRAAGVKRVAVSSAIASAPDPETATRRFIEAMAA